MLIKIVNGITMEIDAATAKILIDAGKAHEVKTEAPAEKKTRKKVNND